jgi:hypothetical protein
MQAAPAGRKEFPMYINFYTLPYQQGICCERCGTYIRNVAEIHFDDGFVLRCGLDCLNKHVLKETNLTDYGKKSLKRYLNSLRKYNECRELWKSCANIGDLIEAHKQNPKTWLFVMWECYGWKAESGEPITQEMFDKEKGWILESFIPYRIQHEQEEMKKKFRNTKYRGEAQKAINSQG